MLPARPRNPFRTTSEYRIESLIEGLQESLTGPGRTYQVSHGGQIGDLYHRIVISGGEFQGRHALTMDIRAGGPSPGGSPALFLRGRGTIEDSPEAVITSKLIPSQPKPGILQKPYELRTSIQSLADLVQASFESTERTRQRFGQSERSIQQEMFAILTSDRPEEYQDVRSKYFVPRGIQQVWGQSSQGEQLALSRGVSLYTRTEDYDVEFQRVSRQLKEGLLPAISNMGVYAPERIGEGAYQLSRLADVRTLEREGIEPQRLGLVHRADVIKHLKYMTGVEESRSPIVQAYRRSSSDAWVPIESGTMKTAPGMQFGETLLSRGLGVLGGGTLERDAEGRLVQTGARSSNITGKIAEIDQPTILNTGVIRPGESVQRQVRVGLAVAAYMPFHSGAGMISPETEEDIAGYMTTGLGPIIDLPYGTAEELKEAKWKFKKNFIGETIGGGRESGLVIGHADKTPIRVGSRAHTQQIEAATLIIPRFMTQAGEFFPSDVGDISGDLRSTEELAKLLQETLSPHGVNVEASGHDRPYMKVSTKKQIVASGKGSGTKQGNVAVGGPGRLRVEFEGGEQVQVGAVIQEYKQMVSSFIDTFGAHPYENKMDIIRFMGTDERVEKELEKWARGLPGLDDESIAEGRQGAGLRLDQLENKYEELTGEKLSYYELFQKSFDRIRNAKGDKGWENLMKFAIGRMPKKGKVYAGRVTQDFVNATKQNLDTETMGHKSLTEAGIEFVPTKESDMFDFYFTVTPENSMLMLSARGMAAEWPAKGGQLNREIVAALNTLFPTFAKDLNITPEAGPLGGQPTQERKSWLGIAHAFALQMSADEGHTLDIKKDVEATDEAPGMQVITPGIASELMRKGLFSSERGGKTEEQVMKELIRNFGWNTLVFDKGRKFLPSPQSIYGVDIFDEAIDEGMSKTHYATQYIAALSQMLSYTMGTGQNLDRFARLMGGLKSRIGRNVAESKEIQRYLHGRDVEGAVGGKYRVLYGLKPGEAYLPHEEILRIGRQMGLKTDDELQMLLDEFANKPTSGLFWRYPTLAEEQGVAPVTIVTEDEMKRRGINLKAFRSSEPGSIYVNPFTPEMFIGDEDLDPHGFLTGLRPIWEGKGKKRRLMGFRDALSKDPNYQRFKEHGWNYANILKQLVGDEHYEQFSTMFGAQKEYLDALTGVKTGPMGTASELGMVPEAEILHKHRLWRQILQRRGTSHMAIKAFEIAAATLGVPSDIYKDAIAGLPLLYQQSLETSKRAWTETPLETLAKTIRLRSGEDPTRGQRFLEISAAFGMVEKGGRTQPDFQTGIWSGSTGQGLRFFSELMVQQLSPMTQLTNEALALGFANPKNYERSYAAILDKIKNAKPGERADILLDPSDDLIAKGMISPYGLVGTSHLALMVSRTLKKAREPGTTDYQKASAQALRDQIYNERTIPYMGKKYTVAELAEQPQISAFLRFYSTIYGRPVTPGGSAFLGAHEVGELAEQYKGSEYMIARSMVGLSKFYRWGEFKKQRLQIGGRTAKEIQDELMRGPSVMRASEVSAIVGRAGYEGEEDPDMLQGMTKYGLGRIMSRGAKWLGGFLNISELTKLEDPFKATEQQEYFYARGNEYEDWVARQEMLKYAEGQPAWALVPRNTKAEAKRLEFKIGETELSGLEDLYRVVMNDKGQPVFQLLELKWGKQSMPAAKVQSRLYGEGYRQYGADPSKHAQLKEILQSRVASAQEYYPTQLAGYHYTPLQHNFVDLAMRAIKEGRIELYAGHGGGRDIRKQEGMFEVSGPLEIGDVEADVALAREVVRRRIAQTWRTLRGMVETGEPITTSKGVELQLQPSFGQGIPQATWNSITRLLERTKFFQTTGSTTGANIDPEDAENIKKGVSETQRRVAANVNENIVIETAEGAKVQVTSQDAFETISKSLQELNDNVKLMAGNFELVGDSMGGGRGGGFYSGNQGVTMSTARKQAAIAQYRMLITPSGETGEGPNALEQYVSNIKRVLANVIPEISELETPEELTTAVQQYGFLPQIQRGLQTALKQSRHISTTLGGMEKQALSGAPFVGTEAQRKQMAQMFEDFEGPIPEDMDVEARTRAFLGYAGLAESAKVVGAAAASSPQAQAVLAGTLLTPKQAEEYASQLEASSEKLSSALKDVEGALFDNEGALKENAKLTRDQVEVMKDTASKGWAGEQYTRRRAERQQMEAEIAEAGYSKVGKQWYGPTGAPVTGEEWAEDLGPMVMKKDQAMERELRAAFTAFGGERGEGVPSRTDRLGGALRGIFGGFGMMYMQRVLGWGIQGLTQGFPEYEQYATQQMMMRSRMYGMQPEQTAGLAMQQALVRAGGGLGGQLTRAQAGIIGTPGGDVWSAIKGAGGFGLAASFMASELGPAIAPGFATAALPFIGAAALGVGAGLMGLQQYGYAQRPDWSIQRAAGAQAFGGFGADYYLWGINQLQRGEEEGGGWKGTIVGMGKTFQHWAEGLPEITMMHGVQPGVPQEPLPPTPAEMERHRLATLASTYVGGGGAPTWNEEDIGKIIGTVISRMDRTPFAPYSPDVASRAMETMLRGGITDVQAALKYAGQLQAQLPVDELARNIIQVQRQLPSTRGLAQAVTLTAPTEAGVFRQQIGVSAMGQFGNVAAQYMGLPYIPQAEMPRAIEQYAQYSQRPWWQFATQAGGLAERAYQIGAQYSMPTPEELGMMTGPERMQAYSEYARGAQAVAMGEQRAATLPTGITGYLNRQLFREGITGREFGAEFGAIPLASQIYQMTGSEGAFRGAYQALAGATMQGSPQVANILSGVLQGNPMAMAQFYGGRGGFGLTRPFIAGMQAPVDVNLQGQVTGLPMYTSQISPADLNRMFGAGQWGVAGAAAAPGFGGGEMVAGRMISGVPGIQAAQRHAQLEYQQEQLERAASSQALQRQYFLGGGQFGRGLWAVQDDLRALGIQQQRWQFGQQLTGLGMQRTQFQENMALQARGMQMNQAFTREMWGFQDIQRQMQWGWRQEDFEEQRRFMTGRQRRLAERQMERETIMYGMTEEQIDKQRTHQEELWQLEEERFELQKSHYEENYEFQVNQIKKQREYFEERTKLEQEQLEITRAYQLAQMDQAQANLEAQREHNVLMGEYADQLQVIALDAQEQADNWQRSVQYTDAIGQVLDDIEQFAKRMQKMGYDIPEGKWKPPKNIPEGASNQDNTEPEEDEIPHNIPQQHGGLNIPYTSYLVGERGPEIFKPHVPGTMTPLSKWQDSVMMFDRLGTSQQMGKQSTLIINIGNKRLGQYVLDTVNGELEIV